MIAPWNWEVAASPIRQLRQDSSQTVVMAGNKMPGTSLNNSHLSMWNCQFLTNVVSCVLFKATICSKLVFYQGIPSWGCCWPEGKRYGPWISKITDDTTYQRTYYGFCVCTFIFRWYPLNIGVMRLSARRHHLFKAVFVLWDKCISSVQEMTVVTAPVFMWDRC